MFIVATAKSLLFGSFAPNLIKLRLRIAHYLLASEV